MKVTIEFDTNDAKIIDVIEFRDYKHDESIEQFSNRVYEHIDCAIKATKKSNYEK